MLNKKNKKMEQETFSAMPENQIKELLSRNFIETIASKSGYKIVQPQLDNGVDLTVTFPIAFNNINGKKRIYDSGYSIDIQLKATTEKYIYPYENGFGYDLKVNNYDDLLRRKRSNSPTPLILIVFILPETKNNWLDVKENELILRKNAFWYYPENIYREVNSISTIRINLRKENLIEEHLFTKLFKHFFTL